MNSQNGQNLNFHRKVPERLNYHQDPSILLHPQRPKPLHGVNPRNIMGETAWVETSERIRRNVLFCEACGASKFIKGHFDCHEIYEINYEAGYLKFIKFVAICKDCHNFIHIGRLKALRKKKEVSHQEYTRILERGKAILKNNKLKKKIHKGSCAKWDKWRLIYEGKEYKPEYKSYEEWNNHFNKGQSVKLSIGTKQSLDEFYSWLDDDSFEEF